MIAIMGGGIAGLWTLALLRKRGYNAVLLEKNALGCQQTLASQGIIHGGAKYALTGVFSEAAKAIGTMPQKWLDAHQNIGEVNIQSATISSNCQYLWSNDKITGSLGNFFASKLMKSRMTAVSSEILPSFLQTGFSGSCYALQEPIFDIASVIKSFVTQYGNYIFTQNQWHINSNTLTIQINSHISTHTIDLFIDTAGAGNEALSQQAQQLRPLHMLALKVPANAPSIFGHCLGLSDKPKITITTHQYSHLTNDQEKVYWIGGQPAETGVDRDIPTQINHVQALLKECLPFLDPKLFNTDNFISVRIDRAEALSKGKRPDHPIIIENNNRITVWPTKLAFAPYVAEKIVNLLTHKSISHSVTQLPEHEVAIADYPWARSY